MCKHRDASSPDQTKLNARTPRVFHHRRHRSCHDGKDVVILSKGCGISSPDILDILQPRAGLRIDDAKRLYRWRAGIWSSHIETTITGVVPHLIATADLFDDIEHVTAERAEDDRRAARRHQKMLKRPERDTGNTRTRHARKCFAVEHDGLINRQGKFGGVDTGDHRAVAACWPGHRDPESAERRVPQWLLQPSRTLEHDLPKNLVSPGVNESGIRVDYTMRQRVCRRRTE